MTVIDVKANYSVCIYSLQLARAEGDNSERSHLSGYKSYTSYGGKAI